MMGEADGAIEARVAELAARYGSLEGEALLRPLIEREFAGRLAVTSSFGSEAAILLHMVAQIDRTLPIVFLDTGKLFGETLRYRDRLVDRLGLSDLRTVTPAAEEVRRRDPDGMLWHRDADACCALRKVAPLGAALGGFAAWITGRKRYQGGLRGALPVFEASEERIKINPLALWSRERIEQEFAARDLPPHPLEAEGFLSIGCYPCTARAAPGADRRSGRWANSGKVECGIHCGALAAPARPDEDDGPGPLLAPA